MKKNMDESMTRAKKLMMNNDGFARSAQLVENGISGEVIGRLARSGAIVRVKRGLYRWHDADPSSSLIEATRAVPEGIVCLLSAIAFHQLGTRVPRQIELAIHRDANKPVLPEYPPTQLFYFSPLQYETGIMTVQVDDTDVRMYDPEKTLCDCARYRNKIGMDVFREAVAEYMRRPGRDIDKLLTYSRKLRIQSVIQRFAEALA